MEISVGTSFMSPPLYDAAKKEQSWRCRASALQDPFPFHWCSLCSSSRGRPGQFSKGNLNDDGNHQKLLFYIFFFLKDCFDSLGEIAKIFAQNNSIGFVEDWFWHFSCSTEFWGLSRWIGLEEYFSSSEAKVLIHLDAEELCILWAEIGCKRGGGGANR